jgi:hypothetical protein
MTSSIMDRSLELSRIRRLDEAAKDAAGWLEEETRSKVEAGFAAGIAAYNTITIIEHNSGKKIPHPHHLPPVQAVTNRLFQKNEFLLKESAKSISFFSATAFKECHREDRRGIKGTVKKLLRETRNKKDRKREPTIIFLVHTRDALLQAIDKQREPLTKIAIQQIKKGEWVDRLKMIPSSILLHQIAPFLQPPVENPPALSYTFEFLGGNRADAFAEAYLDSFVGRQSRAAARFQALKRLTTISQLVNSQKIPSWMGTKQHSLFLQTTKLLSMLVRENSIRPSCFALCTTDKTSLEAVLQKSSQGSCAAFNGILHKTNDIAFGCTWPKVYDSENLNKLSQDQADCLTGTIIPIIHLFKEMQKMKHKLAFTSYSPDLLAESPTIAKLSAKKIVQDSLVYSLTERDFRSLKRVNKGFYQTLSHCQELTFKILMAPDIKVC